VPPWVAAGPGSKLTERGPGGAAPPAPGAVDVRRQIENKGQMFSCVAAR
jgi:hypothetical protein